MSVTEQIITVAMCVIGTMITRFLPFIAFSSKKPTPAYINYLGKALPSAVFGMLVIYSLKDTEILTGSHGLPELIAILITLVLHYFRRQMLISIAGGTICYMILIRLI